MATKKEIEQSLGKIMGEWSQDKLADGRHFAASMLLPDENNEHILRIMKEQLENALTRKVVSFLPCTISSIEWVVSDVMIKNKYGTGVPHRVLEAGVSIYPLGASRGEH